MRDAVADDVDDVATIQLTTWRAAYAGLVPDDVLARLSAAEHRERWQARLPAAPPLFCLVAVDGGDVVGFVAGGPSRTGEAGVGQVYALYVSPARWRGGAGRTLLVAAEGRLRDAGFERAVLWVLTTNTPARAFYEACGWPADGRTATEPLHGAELPVSRHARRLGAG